MLGRTLASLGFLLQVSFGHIIQAGERGVSVIDPHLSNYYFQAQHRCPKTMSCGWFSQKRFSFSVVHSKTRTRLLAWNSCDEQGHSNNQTVRVHTWCEFVAEVRKTWMNVEMEWKDDTIDSSSRIGQTTILDTSVLRVEDHHNIPLRVGINDNFSNSFLPSH